jgi:hypothetical protein
MVEEFIGFEDLEDENNDGHDAEECSSEFIDEPNESFSPEDGHPFAVCG